MERNSQTWTFPIQMLDDMPGDEVWLVPSVAPPAGMSEAQQWEWYRQHSCVIRGLKVEAT